MRQIEMPEILGKIHPVLINNEVIQGKKTNQNSIYDEMTSSI